MSATDELRCMLEERGVKCKAWDGVHPITVWHDETYLYEFVEYRLINDAKQVSDCPSDNDGHCELTIKEYNCTPEQAVAATLGADARPTQAESSGTCRATETNHYRVRTDGTGCPLTVRIMECSKCGGTYGYVTGGYEYCPRCGRKVVDE